MRTIFPVLVFTLLSRHSLSQDDVKIINHYLEIYAESLDTTVRVQMADTVDAPIIRNATRINYFSESSNGEIAKVDLISAIIKIEGIEQYGAVNNEGRILDENDGEINILKEYSQLIRGNITFLMSYVRNEIQMKGGLVLYIN
ncbi:MAG: hypothetical protein R2780_14610 [Crocinitomicaceae bacterium]|nr:hypothetical protein [Crocinitomicaceae bacterium]